MGIKVEFELRKTRDGPPLELVEEYPFVSYDEFDSLPRNAIIATARVCRRCQLLEQCSPKISTSPKGLVRKLAIVIKGNQIDSDRCNIRICGVNSTFNISKNRNPIINSLTTIETMPNGDKIFSPRRVSTSQPAS